jgi:phosphatidylglycerol---prolipoprotein diacylglyceryl transferase
VRQTLFFIPVEVGGTPLIGFGILLAVWAIGSLAILGWLVRRQGFNADTRSYIPVLALMGAAVAFLLPNLAIESGFDANGDVTYGVPIRGYGVMLLLAVSSGVALGVYRGQKRGIPADTMLSLAFWLFLSGIVGARAFFVIEYWNKYNKGSLIDSLKAIVSINEGGLVVYGSLIGAGIATILFVRKHHLNGLVLGDALAPAMVLGAGIGRIGCLLNGCCFGGTCDVPWAVTFPIGSPPYRHQVDKNILDTYGITFGSDPSAAPTIAAIEPGSVADRAGLNAGETLERINGHPAEDQLKSVEAARNALLGSFYENGKIAVTTSENPTSPHVLQLPSSAPRSQPVHPAQIYSAIDAILLCLFLLAYDPLRRHDGELVAWMLTLHPISRFMLEIVRIDEGAVFGTGLSISQNVSILLLAVAAVLWCYLLTRDPSRTSRRMQPKLAGS